MNPQKNQNAVKTLLLEYEKAIVELQNLIQDISQNDLICIVNPETENPDCISIQAILTHIVGAGYSYCVYIQNARNIDTKRPERIRQTSVDAYKNELNAVLKYTHKTFSTIYDSELEVYDNNKKILTSWGQSYDIEQLMEHAIVHILRHRRQIERFKIQLS
jgi:uncharacterized damage-inducible protein DinB